MTIPIHIVERMDNARDTLKAAQEKVVELTTNPHRSLVTRSLYDAVEVYNKAVAEVIDALNEDK